MREAVIIPLWICMVCLIYGDTTVNDTTMDGHVTQTDSSKQFREPLHDEVTITSAISEGNPIETTPMAPTETTIVAKSFKDEEKEILDFINSIMRQILPRVVRGSSTTLSQKCTAAMMRIFGGLRKLKGWTLKMLDSSGKPASGILGGTPYSVANFDQCLNISVTNRGEETTKPEDEWFHGKYCRFRIDIGQAIIMRANEYKQGKINGSQLRKLREAIDSMAYVPLTKHPFSHFLGLCLPSLCTTDDITKILETLPVPGSTVLDYCKEKENSEVDFEKRIVLGIFFFLLFIVGIGSAVDKLVHFLAEENLNAYLKRRAITIAISFSIFSNTEKLFQRVENDSSDLPNWRALRGLVVGAVFSLIVYHTYFPPFEAFYLQASNLSNLENYLNQRRFSLIVCLPVAIEILFLSYGFSLTNKIWKSTWKNGKQKVNIFYIIIASYIRLCLPLLLVTGIIILLPLLGSGPFWDDIFGPMNENCQAYWWHHLAIFGNFLEEREQCFPHFWFVPCLLQIIFVATILTYIVSRCRKFGAFLIVSSVLGCIITVGILTFNRNYSPANFAYFVPQKTEEFWMIHEALPLNHVGSFAIGMLLGILMAKNHSVNLKPVQCLIGWILSLGYLVGMSMIIFEYRGKNSTLSTSWAAAFASMHRPLFSAAIGWIFWVCAYGYGGFLGRILSWSVVDPIYRMSYFAYLIHLILIAFHVGTAKDHFVYSHGESIMRSLGYIFLTYTAAYVCCLIIDLPLKSLRSALTAANFRQVNITSLHNIARFRKPSKQIDVGYFNAQILENGQNGAK